ncbi:uncharacterized protein LOC142165048 [Nicotiana tabacum]|uniref:Uncharacterized protein LOC142165048 n=1 Tax=Nicotiana tabacum TaxID=4097 RepID=A0AC58S469_TOBAC
MGRSTSTSSSILLALIFVLSFDLFGANLRVNAVTPLIQKACENTGARDFCYNIMENDPEAPWAKTKLDLEFITLRLAQVNYKTVHRKVWTITANETNPEYKQIYRKCLHQYNLLKSEFRNLMETLLVNGNIDLAAQAASNPIFVCERYFTPGVPNPISEDNKYTMYFFDLMRDMYLTPF